MRYGDRENTILLAILFRQIGIWLSNLAIPRHDAEFVLSWKTLAELVRLPNVFSAVTDILLGYFLAQAFVSTHELLSLAVPLVATVCLYWAGMVLNDYFDADVDAVERAFRPIPSGRIGRAQVGRIGFALLIAGVAVSWLALPLFDNLRPGLIGLCVASSVLAYDAGLNRTPLGPIAMGSCRFFNVLLGAAMVETAASPWFPQAVWLAAGGVGCYIVGVTFFARTEATVSSRGQLIGATAIMFAGLALVSLIPHSAEFPNPLPPTWWPAIFGFALLIVWRVQRAVRDPRPERVQPAVGGLLRLLIFLDALALCTGNVYVALGMLLFVPLARLLGRWIYST